MSKRHTLALVLMAAGQSSRFSKTLPVHQRIKKQWIRINDIPLWKKVLEDLKTIYPFDEVIITADEMDQHYMQHFCDSDEKIILGGETRSQSLRNAIKHTNCDYVFVTDVARCNFDQQVYANLLKNFENYDCSAPFLSCPDTAIYQNSAINRDELKLIQTPQISKTKLLEKFLLQRDYTDESSAMIANQANVRFLEGSYVMRKITFLEDLKQIIHFDSPSQRTFTGNGIDIHAFEKTKKMYLGGVLLETDFGFKAHSDGDVLIHAIIDALLGAIGAGDIGEWFPDNDPSYHQINSSLLLEKIYSFIVSVGFEIHHIDVTILTETPKISPYKQKIKRYLSSLLHISEYHINIKATTGEKMGFIGRSEGTCVFVTANLAYIDWKKLLRGEK